MKLITFFTYIDCIMDIIQASMFKRSIYSEQGSLPVYFVNCNRIPQQIENKFVAEYATLLVFLIFFANLDFTSKMLKRCFAQNRSKNRQICRILNQSGKVCGIHKQ